MGLFGVKLKKDVTGTVRITLARLQERYEAKALLKGEAKEKTISKELDKDFLRHTIEGIEVDMKNANEVAEKVAEESYRLVMNDLILLKTLIHCIEEIKETNNQIIHENLLGNEWGRKIRIEEKEIENDLTYIKSKLSDARVYIEELTKTAEKGDIAIKLGFKRKGFIDWRLLNYLSMRGDISVSISHIVRMQKNINELDGIFKNIRAHKAKEDDMTKFIELEKKSAKDARKSSSHIFDLLEKNCIIMYIVLKIIRKELVKEIEAVKKFEIPAAMEKLDEEKKKHILNVLEHNFRVEHESILQEWQMI
jgi:hypothetical protein